MPKKRTRGASHPANRPKKPPELTDARRPTECAAPRRLTIQKTLERNKNNNKRSRMRNKRKKKKKKGDGALDHEGADEPVTTDRQVERSRTLGGS